MKFKFFMGIDISKKKLDITLYDCKNPKKSKHIKVNNNQRGFEEINQWCKKNEADLSKALVCMEHTGV